jgi:transcription elongation GreA/GreB family factor
MVRQGSRVRFREEDGDEHVLLIRGEPADWSPAGSISPDTPLARALMGHRVGDEVEVHVHPVVPVRKVTVLAIE